MTFRRQKPVWQEPPPRHRMQLRRAGFVALALLVAVIGGTAWHWPQVGTRGGPTASSAVAAISGWPRDWMPDRFLAWQWERLDSGPGVRAEPPRWPDGFSARVLARIGPSAGIDHLTGRPLPRGELRLVPIVPYRLVSRNHAAWLDPRNDWLWLPVSAASAEIRAGRGLDRWQPATKAVGCPYVRRWMRARIRFDMPIPDGERRRGLALLAQC